MAEPERRLPPRRRYTLPRRWIEAVRADTPPVLGGTPAPLPGYLCETCLDAPAIAVVPAPWGGRDGRVAGVSAAPGSSQGRAGLSRPCLRRARKDIV